MNFATLRRKVSGLPRRQRDELTAELVTLRHTEATTGDGSEGATQSGVFDHTPSHAEAPGNLSEGDDATSEETTSSVSEARILGLSESWWDEISKLDSPELAEHDWETWKREASGTTATRW